MPTDRQMDEFVDALKRVAAILRDEEIPFALGGGLAAWARGGPETDHDVDFFVKPEDAERALEALEEAGMNPEKPPEEWLYKAWDGDALVDLIFEPEGLTVDDDMLRRGGEMSVLSMRVPVLALEDVLTTKLLSLRETYLDYSGLLQLSRSLREQVDWQQVRRRTEGSPFARAFFFLLEQLDVVPQAEATA